MLDLLRWLIRLGWPFRLANPLFGGYNPFLREFREDPYPAYRALREQHPVTFHRVFKAWMLTRHEDAVRVLKSPGFSVDRTQVPVPRIMSLFSRPLAPDFKEAIQRNLLMLDPPDHTRIRNLVNKAFTRRVVEGMRPRIQTLVDELLDAAEPGGEMELMRDFAVPLPIKVIAEMLGVPPEDHVRFKSWSEDMTALLDPFHAPKGLRGAQEAFVGLSAYFREIFAERRREPRDDLVSRLVAVEEEGDALTEAELLSTCVIILGAGHETTTKLIGNAVVALLRHPDERKRFADDPSIAATAVDEFLRFDSPVQLTDRVATEDIEIGGHVIRKGQLVAPILAAANRDPEVFAEPDRLDLGRRDNPHVAFSLGNHFCLGAQLARAEAEIALTSLFQRFPDLDGDPNPPRVPSMLLRGPASLPLTLR
ncbi:MAG: cytochrome P450 [Myxococcota bacterium]|nr:cytochrome P450 [Myxococcota bacterium]